jgi:hypothetical protein
MLGIRYFMTLHCGSHHSVEFSILPVEVLLQSGFKKKKNTLTSAPSKVRSNQKPGYYVIFGASQL